MWPARFSRQYLSGCHGFLFYPILVSLCLCAVSLCLRSGAVKAEESFFRYDYDGLVSGLTLRVMGYAIKENRENRVEFTLEICNETDKRIFMREGFVPFIPLCLAWRDNVLIHSTLAKGIYPIDRDGKSRTVPIGGKGNYRFSSTIEDFDHSDLSGSFTLQVLYPIEQLGVVLVSNPITMEGIPPRTLKGQATPSVDEQVADLPPDLRERVKRHLERMNRTRKPIVLEQGKPPEPVKREPVPAPERALTGQEIQNSAKERALWNVQAILLVIVMYRTEEGKFPPDLPTLVDPAAGWGLDKNQLKCPAQGPLDEDRIDYVYDNPGWRRGDIPGRAVILWDKAGNREDGGFVGYANGAVRFIAVERDVWQQLIDALANRNNKELVLRHIPDADVGGFASGRGGAR